MFYHLVERPNPLDPSAPNKFYPQLILNEKIGLRRFAKEIVSRSSLTQGDVESCLENFIDQIPFYLLIGHPVKLGDFGTLRLTVHSNGGAPTIGEWDSSLIKCVKVIFTPGPVLKSRLKDEATFELKLPKEVADERRLSRAKAILRSEKNREQILQSHFQSMDKEEALRQLRALQEQIETAEEWSEDFESETSSSEASSAEAISPETTKKPDKPSETSSTDSDTPQKK